jgi:tetratricopeptide (TPR) repeat protein
MSKLNMLFVAFIIALLNISCQSKEIDYKGKYETLSKDKKYDELEKHLQAWEAKEPNNPEMYIAYSNYYINRNISSGVSVYRDPTGDYIEPSMQFNNDDVAAAVKKLDKALNIAPNRLDIRFGKVYILNEIEHYKAAGVELLATLEFSKKIDNNWLWANNEKIRDAESFFWEKVNGYYGSWFNKGTEEAMEQLKLCAEKQKELYPKNIFAYNFLGAYYGIRKQREEALKYFLQAETIDPNDYVVLSNIAETYLEMDNKQKAKEYFTKILKIGNEEYKEGAEYFMNKLR